MRSCVVCQRDAEHKCHNPRCKHTVCARHVVWFELNTADGAQSHPYCSRVCWNAERGRYLSLNQEALMGALIALVLFLLYWLVVRRFL
jgi:hypothetical protein